MTPAAAVSLQLLLILGLVHGRCLQGGRHVPSVRIVERRCGIDGFPGKVDKINVKLCLNGVALLPAANCV